MNKKPGCAKERFKPWIISLIILIIVIVGWLIFFGKNWRSRGNVWEDKMVAGKVQLDPPGQAAAPVPAPDNREYSYSAIVQAVKPSVVGISLQGAGQPFLQKWNGTGTQNAPSTPPAPAVPPPWPSKDGEGEAPLVGRPFMPAAWGNTLSMPCPNCGANVSRQQGVPWTSVTCPNCGSGMNCIATGAQPQAWGFNSNIFTMPCPNCGTIVNRRQGIPWASIACPDCGASMFCPRPGLQTPVQAQQNPATAQPQAEQVTKDEYLSCPNCALRINHQPGIPWSGAKCPSCGTTMARVISLQNQVTAPAPAPAQNPWGQPQVWQPSAGTQPQAQVQAPVAQQPQMQPPAENMPNQLQNTAQLGSSSIGSGIIVSQKGYVLTNAHYISGQNTIMVTLFSEQGQKQLAGQVVAVASDRDLAIVKIDPLNLNLSAALIGNSDKVRAGDTVLAFGNPFGLSQTVTSGIVSAIRQSITIEGHQLNNLIQTDAPINQGNSGGPLVNMQGEIVGINTAIYSPGQTHTGLGFAVPMNQAVEVFSAYMDMEQQNAKKVAMQYLNYQQMANTAQPGAGAAAAQPPNPPANPAPSPATPEDAPVWIGINMQILNDIIAEQLKVPVDRGILINEVYANSPAFQAGLQRGDVIIRFDNMRITDETQLRTLLAEKKAGDKLNLSILRGREKMNITVQTYAGAWQQAIQQDLALKKKPSNLLKGAEIETGSAELAGIGIAVITITPEIAFTYKLPENVKGIVATETEGLALKCGIMDGDIILDVNGKPTPDLISFLKVIKRCDLAKGTDFSLMRKGQPVKVVLKETQALLPKGL